MLNERYNQILEFEIEPFELVRKIRIPDRVKAKSLFIGPRADYFLAIGDNDFAIVGRDGNADINPVEIFGSITSAAFDSEGGRLVLQDSYDSIALLTISKKGHVTESWVGGPLLDNQGAIGAGTILPGGPLVLSRSDGQLAMVEFETSIETKKWHFELLDLKALLDLHENQAATYNLQTDSYSTGNVENGDEDSEKIKEFSSLIWLSPIGDARHVIGRNLKQILLIDVEQKKIIDAVAPENIVGHFDQAVGHVISQEKSPGVYRVFWGEEGRLKDQLVKISNWDGSTSNELEYLSILNYKKDAFSLTYGLHGNFERVFRIRLSDSRVLSVNDTPFHTKHDTLTLERLKAVLAIGSRHLVYLHNNSLGKVERQNIGRDSDPLTIKGFNFEEAQRRW